MKKIISFLLAAAVSASLFLNAQVEEGKFPATSISNGTVTMKLYLPDKDKGSYRATRFDWSGIIYSLKWNGHEYFDYWKSTHDPLFHEDLCGPVEGSITPGFGYTEAKPGEYFVRLGVGSIEKRNEKAYGAFETYKILDFGKWKVKQGPEWIEFRHTLKTKNGWGYVYTKRISLKTAEPGFIIHHNLKNTGSKTMEFDQFNHNFFMIDGELTGKNIKVEFPFNLSSESDLKDLVRLDGREVVFLKDFAANENVFVELKGYGTSVSDHMATVTNTKSGAAIRLKVDKPLHRFAFWSCQTTQCPENFIWIKVEPGQMQEWNSDYTLFTTK